VSDKVNILMVDDQPAKLLSYEVILSELDENLIKATSGREALEQLLKNDVAVVLMDVSMPELDGFELAEIIRQHPRFQKTAIIFISAVHLSDMDRLKGYERGAVDYISVPVVPEVLRAKVSIFVDLHRKTQQLETLNLELEERVAERTEELGRRAEALELVNSELARRNQEMAALIKTAPAIIFSSAADGDCEYISERFFEYTGIPPASANGLGWLASVHPDDFEKAQHLWLGCVQSGENYDLEFRLRNKTGDYRWFRCQAVPIRDLEGSIVRWYGTCSDTHDSKLLEESMRNNAAELERMVEERTNELRRLSSRLLTMQDEERRRVAREIHDGLGQELVAAKMLLDANLHRRSKLPKGETVSQASELLDHVLQEVRTLSHLLHPPLLDQIGLFPAIRWYVDGLKARGGIETFLDVQPPDFPRLTPELETGIFRILQEALTNIYRHSQAKHCWITIIERRGTIQIQVRDDGKGVRPEIVEMRPGSIGVGIGGMMQRARELGGEMQISNAAPGAIVDVVIQPGNLEARERVELEGAAAAPK
jgi:PAS domain S-box-containing protein